MKQIFAIAFLAAVLVSSGLGRRAARCPTGCECSRARIQCYQVDNLELEIGGRFGHSDVVVVSSRLSKVTCFSAVKARKVVYGDFRRSSPADLVCEALRCGDLMARSLFSGSNVSVCVFLFFVRPLDGRRRLCVASCSDLPIYLPTYLRRYVGT